MLGGTSEPKVTEDLVTQLDSSSAVTSSRGSWTTLLLVGNLGVAARSCWYCADRLWACGWLDFVMRCILADVVEGVGLYLGRFGTLRVTGSCRI